jgi:hypothetical protein
MVLAALEALAPDDVEFLSAETDIPAAAASPSRSSSSAAAPARRISTTTSVARW